jgi:hypothetical protein
MWLLHARPSKQRELTVELGDLRLPRRTRVRSGDVVIVFERQADDVIFWAQGKVRAVSGERVERMVEDEQVPFTRFTATVDELSPLAPERSLIELRYSLERVRNFAKPELHFRRDYGRLSSRDARVITNDLIHWSRTATGMMAEAITTQDQLELARRWQELPKQSARSHRVLARLVLDFIESNYGSFASLLAAACDQAAVLEQWGDLVVATEKAESVESTMNLSSVRDEAAEFGRLWKADDNPFRTMLAQDEAQIFTSAKVDANEVQKLLLFR